MLLRAKSRTLSKIDKPIRGPLLIAHFPYVGLRFRSIRPDKRPTSVQLRENVVEKKREKKKKKKKKKNKTLQGEIETTTAFCRSVRWQDAILSFGRGL